MVGKPVKRGALICVYRGCAIILLRTYTVLAMQIIALHAKDMALQSREAFQLSKRKCVLCVRMCMLKVIYSQKENKAQVPSRG